MSAIEEKKE